MPSWNTLLKVLFIIILIAMIAYSVSWLSLPSGVTTTTTVPTTVTSTTFLTETLTTTRTTSVPITITTVSPTTVVTTEVKTLTTTKAVTVPTTVTTILPTTVTTYMPIGGLTGTYSVGEVFRIGNFEFACLGYTMSKYIKEKEIEYYYYSAWPQRKLVIVWLMIKNVGTKVDSPPWHGFYLVTDKRNTYSEADPSFDLEGIGTNVTPEIASQAIEYHGLISLELYPSENYTATVVFQVLEDENPAIFLVEYLSEYFIVPLK